MVAISCTEEGLEQTATSHQGTGTELPGRTCSSGNKKTIPEEENILNNVKKSWTFSPPIKINAV